ncbi:MAG: hypothetical protein QOH18_1467 [Solirubrobacterales bacterium]|jgi:hypothetical protein|nr:hypothetical protein [Solirubrobacterales bacterium]
MPTPPTDPEGYRRRQRRRALIGWFGGFLAIVAFFVLLAVGDGDHQQRRIVKVPYGDVMTSHDFEEVHLGEEDVVVLERLAESGRPENLTKEFVLVLFPPVPEGAYCVYWEFSDEQQIFARLCFSTDTGEMVDKRKHSVLHPPVGGQSTVV